MLYCQLLFRELARNLLREIKGMIEEEKEKEEVEKEETEEEKKEEG
ncbi:hypothetical protein ES703_92004 [subsurface metagenome]